MNKLSKIAVAVGVLSVLVACSPSREEVERAENQTKANAQAPKFVVNLPDGRPIHRIRVVVPGNHDHYVYYIDNADVTTNRAVQNGKTTANNVTASLSVNPTVQEVIDLAERLKVEQREADLKEYQRLKTLIGE